MSRHPADRTIVVSVRELKDAVRIVFARELAKKEREWRLRQIRLVTNMEKTNDAVPTRS